MYYDTDWTWVNWNGGGDSVYWQGQGYDAHSTFNKDPDFVNAGEGNYRRNDSLVADMNVTYGGKTWTKYGAFQPSSGGEPPEPGTRHKMRMKK